MLAAHSNIKPIRTRYASCTSVPNLPVRLHHNRVKNEHDIVGLDLPQTFMRLTRRTLTKSLLAAPLLRAQSNNHTIAKGPFQPTWESLHQYKAPEWFRDAKFGIWAHWSAQCVPEQGDWYARNMYIQGHPQNVFHVATYGHPSKVGFKDIDHMWKAENWRPEELMQLYVKAGAKYFVALANHHDNLDCYN